MYYRAHFSFCVSEQAKDGLVQTFSYQGLRGLPPEAVSVRAERGCCKKTYPPLDRSDRFIYGCPRAGEGPARTTEEEPVQGRT